MNITTSRRQQREEANRDSEQPRWQALRNSVMCWVADWSLTQKLSDAAPPRLFVYLNV